jgi:hypothetical protein
MIDFSIIKSEWDYYDGELLSLKIKMKDYVEIQNMVEKG